MHQTNVAHDESMSRPLKQQGNVLRTCARVSRRASNWGNAKSVCVVPCAADWDFRSPKPDDAMLAHGLFSVSLRFWREFSSAY